MSVLSPFCIFFFFLYLIYILLNVLLEFILTMSLIPRTTKLEVYSKYKTKDTTMNNLSGRTLMITSMCSCLRYTRKSYIIYIICNDT